MGNPFPLSGYHGPELFCDREAERDRLTSNCFNGINTLLLSLRRMGKTGLLHHLMHWLKSQHDSFTTIYVDIYPTQNLKDFTDALANSAVSAFPSHKSAGKRLMTLLSSMRPTVTFDPLSGIPQFSFDFATGKDYEGSLHSIFKFLEGQGTVVVLAIDEFQQIGQYPEKNMEALLRSLIQPLKNIRFIFSGSSPHLLMEMFQNIKRPFFSSAQHLYLQPIEFNEYKSFIIHQFSRHKRFLEEDAAELVLSWSRQHTYYTQVLCNRLFTEGGKAITVEKVRLQSVKLLQEQEHIFYQYRQLLTSIQWSLLKAIAKDDKVYHPTSKSFIGRHSVGTAANIQRALQSLMEKEMIYQQTERDGSYYRVYDTFLARWLEQIP